MCEYYIKDIVPFSAIEFDEQLTYLWIWHADKIPPHIGVSVQGKYFSLKASGKDEGLSMHTILQLIERKKITTLALELNSTISVDDISMRFEKESVATSGGRTCLGPIKEALNVVSASKIHDLLDALYERNDINQAIGFNVDDSFAGIPMYELNEIYNRLKKLEDA